MSAGFLSAFACTRCAAFYIFGFHLGLGFVFYGEVEAGFGAGQGAYNGGSGGFDGDGAGVSGGELKSVEQDGGALGVDAVSGEGGDEERDAADGELGWLSRREWK
jgi:hypothetical protein